MKPTTFSRRSFLRSRLGQTTTEYLLIITACVGGFLSVGLLVGNYLPILFGGITDTMIGVVDPSQPGSAELNESRISPVSRYRYIDAEGNIYALTEAQSTKYYETGSVDVAGWKSGGAQVYKYGTYNSRADMKSGNYDGLTYITAPGASLPYDWKDGRIMNDDANWGKGVGDVAAGTGY